MWGPSFSSSKCKPQLKMAVQRVNLITNKKTQISKWTGRARKRDVFALGGARGLGGRQGAGKEAGGEGEGGATLVSPRACRGQPGLCALPHGSPDATLYRGP